jgi:hypothetical protein
VIGLQSLSKIIDSYNKVNISIDLLEKHFKKIFNEKELNLDEFQLNIKKEVDKFEKNIDILNEGVIKFNDVEMDFAIKESKNSKSIGLDEICPLWLKKSNSTTVRHYLLKLMNNIFEIGCFPKEFNLCKLLPIIKNFNKPNDDLNNIRPISISNTIAQLFERLLLNRNYKNFNTSKNQFGFKKNSSCK